MSYKYAKKRNAKKDAGTANSWVNKKDVIADIQ